MASAEDYANWIVQNQDKRGTPEFETVAQAYKAARAKPEKVEATLPEKIAGSAPVRFAYGAAEPILGAVQLVANAASPNVVGKEVNQHLRQFEGMVDAGRRANEPRTLSSLVTGQQPDPGFDVARFAGNVLSPVNAGMAKVLPAATSTLGRAASGAAAGGLGGGLMPVTEEGDYWSQKGAQAGLGAVTGGILSPVAGKVIDAVAPKVQQLITNLAPSQFTGPRASLQADSVLAQALKELGTTAEDLGDTQMKLLRQQVVESLKKGKQINAAAAARKSDFDQLGLPYTQGQITRDPTQFARERNLRGVAGVGEPLQQRFDTQNQDIQKLVSVLRGNPSEEYQAGKQITDVLAGVDKSYRTGTEAPAWNAVRDNVGRAAPLNVHEFSTNANRTLDEQMLGHYLPAEVRNILNDVSSGKIPLNVDSMVKIDQTLSAAQRAAGARTPQALAIGKVRDALNNTPIENQLGEAAKEAYKTASAISKRRFDMYKAIPALEAAANGEAPDKFVRDYIISGNVDEVKALAEMLQKTSPEAYQQARAQIGDKITRAAFGENVTGDKLAAPERLARALREIGTDKLKAFYTAGEIEQLKRIARVAGYINTTPSAAPVNTSNTAGAMLSLLGRVPGVPGTVALATALKNAASNQMTVNAAVNPAVPSKATDLTPEAKKRLALLLSGVVGGAGMASAPR